MISLNLLVTNSLFLAADNDMWSVNGEWWGLIDDDELGGVERRADSMMAGGVILQVFVLNGARRRAHVS